MYFFYSENLTLTSVHENITNNDSIKSFPNSSQIKNSFESREFVKSNSVNTPLNDNYSIYDNSCKDSLSIKCRYHCSSFSPICRYVDVPVDVEFSSLLNSILMPQALSWKISYLVYFFDLFLFI